MSDSYDVIIAGGGLVGGSLAIALAESQMRVALIEAVPPESDAQPSFDDRTLALSRGSVRILEQLGIWQAISDAVWPISRIHVSQQRRFGTAVIDAHQQGIESLGFVIKSRELGMALWAQLRDADSIDVYCPATVSATSADGDTRTVCIEDDAGARTLRTRLLVVADGARSRLRQAVGIGSSERDYEQVAVVANVQVDPVRVADPHMAYERFTDQGPLAFLPGAGGRYTAVLARNSASVGAVMEMSDAALLGELQSIIGFRLGRLQKLGRRQAYPLFLVTAEAVTAERAVVIGNAANGLHPVAAQGFNLGLRDVACLAEVLTDAAAEPGEFDAGAASLLSVYADWRRRDQRTVVRFTDSLIRLFDLPGPFAASLRGLSLTAFDILPPAKRELARQTMGLAGRMSRLARGRPLR